MVEANSWGFAKVDIGETLQSGVSSSNLLPLRLDQDQILPCPGLALQHSPCVSGWDSLPSPALVCSLLSHPQYLLRVLSPWSRAECHSWAQACHFASCCSPWPLYAQGKGEMVSSADADRVPWTPKRKAGVGDGGEGHPGHLTAGMGKVSRTPWFSIFI